MDGLLPEILSIYQLAGRGFVVRKVSSHPAAKYADKELINRQVIQLRLFIRQ